MNVILNMYFLIRYTSQKSDNGTTAVYAIVLDWPDSDLKLGSPKTSSKTVVTMLGKLLRSQV